MIPSTTKLDLDSFDRDGIVWPILAIPGGPASGLERKYRHFQQEMTRVRGRECHLKPYLVSTWLPWHQDTPYWNLSTTRVVSVFLAISATTSANGAMKVVPGSHKSGALGQLNFDGDPHEGIARGERKSSEGNLFFYDHIMDVEVDESLARDVELEPGEFSIHHIELLHGGGPNESDHDRIGFVLRYISADTYCRSSKDSAMLVRGSYAGDHFELEPRPAEDFSPEAMQALERAVSFPSGFGDRDMTTGDLQG